MGTTCFALNLAHCHQFYYAIIMFWWFSSGSHSTAISYKHKYKPLVCTTPKKGAHRWMCASSQFSTRLFNASECWRFQGYFRLYALKIILKNSTTKWSMAPKSPSILNTVFSIRCLFHLQITGMITFILSANLMMDSRFSMSNTRFASHLFRCNYVIEFIATNSKWIFHDKNVLCSIQSDS